MSEGAVSDFERWWWFDQRWRTCVNCVM